SSPGTAAEAATNWNDDCIVASTQLASKVDGSQEQAREERLHERKRTVRQRIKWINSIRLSGLILAVICLAFTGIGAFETIQDGNEIAKLEADNKRLHAAATLQESHSAEVRLEEAHQNYLYSQLGTVALAAVSLALFSLCLLIVPRSLRNELVDIVNELDLIAIPSISYEQRAQKQLQIQQLELKRYYNQTLHQSAYIFWVGVASMLIGVAIVVGTIIIVRNWGT